MGARLDELELLAEQKRYQNLCGQKPSQAPAAVTRRDNRAAAAAAVADAKSNLMFGRWDCEQ